MEYGAIDLHKKESQIRIVTAGGQVVDHRIATTRERFTHVFWGRPRMRILVEASTESEWVAQHLEQMGHDVIVADQNYGPMYGHRSRRIKTDRRDVAALAEACQQGTYRQAHRRSARQHEVQCRLNVRQELTQARTRAISLARGITRGAGLRIRSGRTETFLERLFTLEMAASMKATLSPLRSVIEVLDDELAEADAQFETLVASDSMVRRLTTLPGIGPITASAFVAALDVVSRFERAGQVTSYLGLVPQEYSSGEKQRRERIVHSALPHLQSLLVQAAWRVSRASDPRTESFRTWAQAIARRRGKKSGDGRLGATSRAHALRDVARPDRISAGPNSKKAVEGRDGVTSCGGRGLGVEVRSSSWRSKRVCGVWPLSRAVPQRALLLLSNPSLRRYVACQRRARIKG